jgi:hypothetical protein
MKLNSCFYFRDRFGWFFSESKIRLFLLLSELFFHMRLLSTPCFLLLLLYMANRIRICSMFLLVVRFFSLSSIWYY